jgi:hypothetical protein
MSKATKIILSGLVAAGLIITYALVNNNGQNYVIQTFGLESDRSSVFCYNNHNAVSVVDAAEGGIVGAYLHYCGFGNEYYSLSVDPRDVCTQTSAVDKVSCLIDEVSSSGVLSNFIISQTVVESWVGNSGIDLGDISRQQDGYRGVCDITRIDQPGGGMICEMTLCSGGDPIVREHTSGASACAGHDCSTFEGSVDACAGETGPKDIIQEAELGNTVRPK